MSKYTNREVAESFTLWGEYVDPNSEMSETEFNALTLEAREAIVEQCFGADADQEFATNGR